MADDVGAQPVCGGLQGSDIVNREKRIVVLAEADLRTGEFLFDEAVAIEVIGRLERKERGYPDHHRPEHFVADVEVVMGEAAALVRQDAMSSGRWWRYFGTVTRKVEPCSMLLKMK